MIEHTYKIIKTDLNGHFLSSKVSNDIKIRLSIALSKATAEQQLYMISGVFHSREDNSFYKIVEVMR